jgi:chloramphenicol-sensitive protein RarD
VTADPQKPDLGVAAALGAYALWGLVPIFWPLLDRSAATQLLAHRIVWSLLVGAVLVAFLARRTWRRQIADRGTMLRLLLASAVIAVNWGVYIWAVNNGRVTEAALGYYINPLLSILLGVVMFSERLAAVQWFAIGLAFVAVAIITVEYRQPPWAALVLAVSFATYGVVKKKVKVEPVVSLSVESALMTPIALAYLIWLGIAGSGDFGRLGVGYDLLLAATGIVTAAPLLLFAYAAQRIALSVLGLTQYLAPTMQFLLGVLYFRESMSPGRWAGFTLVWIALMIISVHAVLRARRSRRVPVTKPA